MKRLKIIAFMMHVALCLGSITLSSFAQTGEVASAEVTSAVESGDNFDDDFVIIDPTEGAEPDEKPKSAFRKLAERVIAKIPNKTIQLGFVGTTRIHIGDMPGFDKMPLPPSIKANIAQIALEDPKLLLGKEGSTIRVGVTGILDFLGTRVFGELRVTTQATQVQGYSFMIKLTDEIAINLSNLAPIFKSPMFKSLQGAQLKDGKIIFSDVAYDDPDWGRVEQGISLVGTISASGIATRISIVLSRQKE